MRKYYTAPIIKDADRRRKRKENGGNASKQFNEGSWFDENATLFSHRKQLIWDGIRIIRMD
jgi:hypothetical protein